MPYLRLAVTLALILAVSPSPAQNAPPITFPVLPMRKGAALHDARVLRVEPDGLRLQHSTGVSKVRFEDLPDEIGRQFSHDPAAAALFSAQSSAANLEALQHIAAEREQLLRAERNLRAGLPRDFVLPSDGPLTSTQMRAKWLLENAARVTVYGMDAKTVAEVEKRKHQLLSGACDRQAELAALQHNLNWYLQHQQAAEAELTRKRIADLKHEDLSREHTKALLQIADSLDHIAQEVSQAPQIASELANVRSAIEKLERSVPR